MKCALGAGLAGILSFLIPLVAHATTELFADLDPGSPSSSPKDGFLHEGDLWFQADRVLYRFDGTTVTPVVDFGAEGLFSQSRFAIHEGDLCMRATGTSPATGEEIFRYDFDTGLVDLYVELIPGSQGSLPTDLTSFGGLLWFAATNPDIELYRTDGTTTVEMDIWPGAGSSAPYDLTVFDGDLFFIANNPGTGYENLYRVDVITPSPVSPEIQSGGELLVWNGELYMTGTENTGGGQIHRGALWRYDGSGLVLETDVDPSDTVSLPMRNLHAHTDGLLYFRGDDGTTGQELWKYDGSSSNVVQDFRPGTASLVPLELCSVNGRIVFQGRVGNDTELYVSDGTSVSLLEDIRPGSSGSAPKCLTGDREGFSYGGWAYYSANDGASGLELWRTDGLIAAVAAPLVARTGVRLAPPAPNPFRQETRVELTLDRPERVEVEVFDISGRRIQTLHRGVLGSGRHVFHWAPRRVASGVYFVRVSGERESTSRAVVHER